MLRHCSVQGLSLAGSGDQGVGLIPASKVLPGAFDATVILGVEVLQEINFGMYLDQQCWHAALPDA